MIIFESVRWKNFLSTGNNFTEINLNKTNNTLIVGDNGKEKTVTCETTQQFMDVLEVVTDLLEPERIEYADLAIHGKNRR